MSSPLQNWAKSGLNIPIVKTIATIGALLKGRDPNNIEEDINNYWNPHQIEREVNNIKQQTGVNLNGLFNTTTSSEISQDQINCVRYLAKQYSLGNFEYEDLLSILENEQSVAIFQQICKEVKIEYQGESINNPTLRNHLRGMNPAIVKEILTKYNGDIEVKNSDKEIISPEIVDLSKRFK